MNCEETAALRPGRGISTVKLEIDIPVLMNLFSLLAQQGHKEIAQRFLIQLKNEEYFYDEDVSAWAAHYQLGSPLFW